MGLSVAESHDTVGPTNWSRAQLSELFSFSGGFTASRDQLSASVGVPYLHYGDIHGSTKNYINVHDEYLDIPKLDVSLKHIPVSSLLKTGDVVFVDASEDDNGTSRHIVVLNTHNLPFISGLHTVTAKSKSSKLSNNFRRFCFQSESIKRQFKFYAVGTKVSGVSKGNIGKIRLAFPDSLSEQESIAEALTDADAYVESLEQLLIKKQDLKQGVMQSLLTGKTRLPGFNGDWRRSRLADISQIDSDNLESATKADFTFNYIALEDVNTGWLNGYSAQTFSSSPSRARRRIRDGDILVSTVRPNLQSHLLFAIRPGNWVCSTGFSVVRCIPNVSSPSYIYAQIFSDELSRQIDSLLVGSNYPAINSKDVGNLIVLLPEHSEQQAIGSVISDMEAEIRAIELMHDKANAVKQGMMQELLTGKTRLV